MKTLINVHALKTVLSGQVLHDNLSFTVKSGEIFGIVGGSGSGKSVLLHTLLGLMAPSAGDINILGVSPQKDLQAFQKILTRRIGVLFQDGALFSSLTVLENVMTPLQELLKLPLELSQELALMRLSMVGLSPKDALKYPSQISGGMRKRVGLARALVLDPEIVFLDEPTAGLDPIAASSFDHLVLDVQKNLGTTVVMITHDLDTLRLTCDRIGVLLHHQMTVGTIKEHQKNPDPWMQWYFNGERAHF